MLRMMTIWNSQWYALCLHDCTCSHSCNILLSTRQMCTSPSCHHDFMHLCNLNVSIFHRLPTASGFAYMICCNFLTPFNVWIIAAQCIGKKMHQSWYWYVQFWWGVRLKIVFFFLGINMTSWNFHKPGYIWNDWCTLPISQTSTSACCLEYVKTLNVSTPKEATGAHVNQAIC